MRQTETLDPFQLGCFLVDWLDWRVQLDAGSVPDLLGGHVSAWEPAWQVDPTRPHVVDDRTGAIFSNVWNAEKFEEVESSNGQLQIRIRDGLLECRGNPIKFLTGQNISGPSDPYFLIQEVWKRISLILDLGKCPIAARIEITRIDLTQMIDMDTAQNAVDVIHQLGFVASKRKAKHNAIEGTTVYFAKHSRRWAIKVYHKSTELRHKPQMGIDPAKYSKYVRIEVVLRSMELKRINLHHCHNWNEQTTITQFLTHFEKLTIPEGQNMDCPNIDADLLPFWTMWKNGQDLGAWFLQNKSRATFYRFRGRFLAHGIDISRPYYPIPGDRVVNLVDLVWHRARSSSHWLQNAA